MNEEPTRQAGATWAFYTRDRRRHSVESPVHTYAELCYPSPGGAIYRLPLLNISRDGASFTAPPELFELPTGTVLDDLVLQVGPLGIRGRMVLRHVTQDPEGRSVCGGNFEPETDSDRRKLDELIAAFEQYG